MRDQCHQALQVRRARRPAHPPDPEALRGPGLQALADRGAARGRAGGPGAVGATAVPGAARRLVPAHAASGRVPRLRAGGARDRHDPPFVDPAGARRRARIPPRARLSRTSGGRRAGIEPAARPLLPPAVGGYVLLDRWSATRRAMSTRRHPSRRRRSAGQAVLPGPPRDAGCSSGSPGGCAGSSPTTLGAPGVSRRSTSPGRTCSRTATRPGSGPHSPLLLVHWAPRPPERPSPGCGIERPPTATTSIISTTRWPLAVIGLGLGLSPYMLLSVGLVIVILYWSSRSTPTWRPRLRGVRARLRRRGADRVRGWC